MEREEVMPRYEHDCERCKPLGEFGEYDLYFCETDLEKRPTVIARYGDGGHEYTSGLMFADFDPAIKEAKRRAVNSGFIAD